MRMRFALSDPTIRRSMWSLMFVIVLALVPAACGSGDDDDVAVASDLMEQWIAGWNGDDPDAIAALFTEDGIFINEGDMESTWAGREEIRRETAEYVSLVAGMESMGPVTTTDDGTFRCPIKFRAGAVDYVAENEFEVDDGLIARLVGQVEFAEDGD